MGGEKQNSFDVEASNIYEGGVLNSISIDELVNSKTAVKQLVNSFNIQARQLTSLNNRLNDKESEVEYLKTSPFIAIVSTLFNAIGACILGLGCNETTSDSSDKKGLVLIILGIVLIIVSNMINILYPYVRRWFNPLKGVNGYATKE